MLFFFYCTVLLGGMSWAAVYGNLVAWNALKSEMFSGWMTGLLFCHHYLSYLILLVMKHCTTQSALLAHTNHRLCLLWYNDNPFCIPITLLFFIHVRVYVGCYITGSSVGQFVNNISAFTTQTVQAAPHLIGHWCNLYWAHARPDIEPAEAPLSLYKINVWFRKPWLMKWKVEEEN